MKLTEKAAYIKGLMEGLDLDADKKEVKLIKALVDLVDDLALTVTDLDEDLDQVYDELDAIDEDLTIPEGTTVSGDGVDVTVAAGKTLTVDGGLELVRGAVKRDEKVRRPRGGRTFSYQARPKI